MRHENKVRRAGLGRRVLAQLLSLTTAFTLLAPGGGGLLNARAATEFAATDASGDRVDGQYGS